MAISPGKQIFPLSPMQRGILFHGMSAPGSGVYVEHSRFTLEGLDPAAFRQAWELAFDCYPALRTSIVGAGRREPAQVEWPDVDLPWNEYDCRHLSSEEQDDWVESFITEDLARGFRDDERSLTRFTLVRCGEDRYEFIWTTHHLVLDGWSGNIVRSAVFRCYEALTRGERPKLSPPRPFGDFVAWLRRQDLPAAERYWRTRLGGVSGPTVIDGGEVGRGISDYAEVTRRLSAESTRELRDRATRSRVSLNTVVQAAWTLLLGRYSGEDDVIFGSVVSGRPDELDGVASMVGMFINTLPFRMEVPADSKLNAWLRAVQARQLEQRAYEYSPLWDVQRWSGLPPGTPLFESLYVFHNQPRHPAVVDDGSRLRVRFRAPILRVGYPLLLLVAPGPEMTLQLVYDAGRFDRKMIERVLRHTAAVLEAFATARADKTLGDIGLLEPEERRRLLDDWNRTERDYPRERCLHELVARQAARTPGSTALTFRGQHLTYGDLDGKADQLAHHLREFGVTTESLVGIWMERSAAMVIGLLGILKAGAAYVPLDPAFPSDRLRFMLEDANVAAVVTDREHRSGLEVIGSFTSRRGVPVIVMDGIEDGPDEMSRAAAGRFARPENLAYVIYTSGSTGRPKGVQITHRNVVNFLESMRGEPGIESDDVLLAVTTISFDIAGLEIFLPLCVGARVVIADRETASDGYQLQRALHDDEVTLMQATPATWQMLIETGWPGDPDLEMLCGGETLPRSLADTLLERGGGLWNMYGPTETTIWSSVARIEPGRRPVTLGRPIANTRFYVLDSGLNPVPTGVAGELYIGGDGVARGYLGTPELTSERFIADPWADDPSERLYRTGDLVRYDEAGELRFIGRVDFQVKLRGFRIELGEIESRLDRHPGVRESVVLVREDRRGDRRLVAYVVPKQAASPDTSELQGLMKACLPGYMVPSAIVKLEALPLTPHGKVDRKALPAPDLDGEADWYVPPRNGTEEVLCAIWSDVLGVERVGVHDNFFELGGHSLLATQLTSRVRSTLEIEVPARDVFECPTVGELAGRLRSADTRPATAPPVRRDRDGDLPLSFAQQRLWLLDQMGDGAAYVIPMVLRLRGRLDVDRLDQALQEVVRRHEALRTSFRVVDGKPVQQIAGVLGFRLQQIDLCDPASDNQEAEVLRLAQEEAGRLFDLATGPLLRAKLLKLGDAEHILLLTMHHVVSDGWSMGVLFRELTTLYEAFSRGEPSPLTDLDIQYGDFTLWQRSWLVGEALERQLSYWREQLAELPALDLPTDRQRPALQTFKGAVHSFEIPPELSATLQRVSRREGLTLAMVLLAGWQVLLSRYSGQTDVTVGSPIANRTHDALEPLIGCFVNTLVMRTDLSGDPTVLELLRRVQEVSLSAYEHQDVPFEEVVDDLNPQRDLSRHPLFQVSFAMQNVPRAAPRLGDLEIGWLELQSRTAHVDLELVFSEHADRLVGALVYNVDLFEASTVERMAGHLIRLLEGMAADPSQRLSELTLLSEAERHQLVVEWNDTARTYPRDSRAHELITEQARLTPGAVAVVCGRRSLTYAELDARSNQVAHYLDRHAVRPGSIVGLCVDRSIEMVVGLLGVHKAGAVYVPLDPELPDDRLRFMLEDSGAVAVATTSAALNVAPDLVPCSDAHDIPLLRLDEQQEIDAQLTSGLRGPGTAEDLAYVIYTSGSTGRPNGVEVTHRNVVNFLDSMRHDPGFASQDVLLAVTTLSFDISVLEVLLPLISGGSVIIADAEATIDPTALQRLLIEHEVTVMQATPAFWQLLLHSDGLEPNPRLRMLSGGEALSRPLADALLEWGGKLGNMYGPTETTVWSSIADVERESSSGSGTVSIGRPIANTQLYVLDRRGVPVHRGAIGELFIGGDGVTRGYRGRPDLTAERFVPDPFRGVPGARMYGTGDLVRYDCRDRLQFLGRIDHQVKLRGFRIELGEIESVLRRYEGVREAVVDVRADGPGGSRLIGYVGADASLSGRELQSFVTNRLPHYMVPTTWVVLESLPLTPSGKVDRRALPQPETARGSETLAAPRSSMERMLADTWKEVIGVEEVGLYDNFFDLGGHSLLLVQAVGKMQDETGLRIDLRQYVVSTLGQLARSYELARDEPDDLAEVPAGKGSLSVLLRSFVSRVIPARRTKSS